MRTFYRIVPPGRRLVVGASIAGVLAVMGMVLVVWGVVAGGRVAAREAAVGRPTGQATAPASKGAMTELEQALATMRAMPPVAAATSVRYPAVGKEAKSQPDLYAAAFTQILLTQDYRMSRAGLISWVASESVQSTEPRVVGLTPIALRPKLALWSVQVAGTTPAVVPSVKEWAALGRRQGYQSVRILRVTQPVAWAGAVANGEITDPGVTARQIDAETTVHTVVGGKAVATRFSVSLSVQLEGPPTVPGYGFVCAVIYNVVKMS